MCIRDRPSSVGFARRPPRENVARVRVGSSHRRQAAPAHVSERSTSSARVVSAWANAHQERS
eukprot:7742751-Alexandrium_andersonii.AAC.1